eukprot:jgi/Chlat1/1894/Chrsp145S00774
MAAAGGRLRVSQAAFDAAVQENIEEFGLDPEAAVSEAAETFRLQGADLTGVIQSIDGAKAVDNHPAVVAARALQARASALPSTDGLAECLQTVTAACQDVEGARLAGALGCMQFAADICARAPSTDANLLLSALTAVRALAVDPDNKEAFCARDSGTAGVVTSLKHASPAVRAASAGAIAALSLAHEGNKVNFVYGGAAPALVAAVNTWTQRDKTCETAQPLIHSICDAIVGITSDDDQNAMASKAFAHARELAKEGAALSLLAALRVATGAGSEGLSTDCISTICNALRKVAANDEICREIASAGGVEELLGLLADKARTEPLLARDALGLLRQLAGSDAVKGAVTTFGGIPLALACMQWHIGDAAGFAMLAAVTLRNPEGAQAVMEADGAAVVFMCMQQQEMSAAVLRQACLLIRNLVVRSEAHRPILLETGVEQLIRRAKWAHPAECKDVGSAALRDLGLDDYNT